MGAGSGIGRATAIRFAEEGARVVASDVDAEGLADTLKAVVDAGHDAKAIRADVAVQADVDRIVAEIGGGIDVLVNNAGVMDHFVPVTELDDAAWERVVAVNLTGVMRLCRAVLPAMCRAGCGGRYGVCRVQARRYRVDSFGRSLVRGGWCAVQCGVCPGGVETNIGVSAAPTVEWAYHRLEKSFTRAVRTARPDEIAAVISWLTSDEASNVNGAVVTADGGWMA